MLYPAMSHAARVVQHLLKAPSMKKRSSVKTHFGWFIAVMAAASSVACSDDGAQTGAGGDGGNGHATGGHDSGGSDAGGGDTMGATAACQACVADVYSNDAQCQAAVQACDADVACNDWKNCSEGCFNENDTVACYGACQQSFPHDTVLSDALLICTCSACANTCAASCAT
jgi:hypothetical protein